MKIFFNHYWHIILISLFAILIMTPGLSRPYFWQDEAETALLARNIMHYGVPMAWDGTNIVTQLSGNDSNAKCLWSFTPWLPFYIVAGSFSMLGQTNFAGRLPFIIIGILSLISLYLFVYQLSRSRIVAALSSLYLLLNFSFILHSRQCKYYSILFLVPPLLLLAYGRLRKDLASFIIFVLSIILIFYTNYISLFTLIAGLVLYTFLAKRKTKFSITFVGAGVLSLLFTLPFFFVGDFGVSSTLISRFPSVAEYADKLARHIWYFNNRVFGLLLFIPLVAFYKKGYFLDDEKKFIRFLLWIIFSAWLVLPLFNQDVFRYNLHLIPLFCALSAFITVAFFRWSRAAGVIFVLLFLTTNIFSNFPWILGEGSLKLSGVRFEKKTEWVVKKFNKDEGKTRKFFREVDKELGGLTFSGMALRLVPRVEYAAYFNELRGDWPDAIAAAVEFLRANAKDGDKLYSNFDMLPLMFYLPNLRYVYSIDPSKLSIPKEPPLPAYITSVAGADWYIWRDVRIGLGPFLTNEEFIEEMKKERRRLVPNDLKVSSLYWDVNWPQKYQTYIDRMLWKDRSGYEDVIIYRLQKGVKPFR